MFLKSEIAKPNFSLFLFTNSPDSGETSEIYILSRFNFFVAYFVTILRELPCWVYFFPSGDSISPHGVIALFGVHELLERSPF